MEKTEKIFADGFVFKMAPQRFESEVGSLSLKSEQAIKFINEHTNKGWVNLKVKISQIGKPYVELDTWKPKPKEGNQMPAGDGLPF